jgi:hypothetical protein
MCSCVRMADIHAAYDHCRALRAVRLYGRRELLDLAGERAGQGRSRHLLALGRLQRSVPVPGPQHVPVMSACCFALLHTGYTASATASLANT